MATETYANNAATTLNGAITNVATSITVASATGFPAAAQYRILIDSEVLLVTAGAGTTSWTVTRGAESTTAASHLDAAAVTHVLTASGLQNLLEIQDEGARVGDVARTLNFVGMPVVADLSSSVGRVRILDPITQAMPLCEDFISGSSSQTSGAALIGWISGGGGSTAWTASETNHPGIYKITSSASSGAFTYLSTRETGGGLPFLPGEDFDLTWILRYASGATINDTNIRVGLMQSVTAAPTDGIYFEKLTTDTTWTGVTRASSAQTKSSGIGSTIAAGTFNRLRIRKVGSNVSFSVDGGTETTQSSNVPRPRATARWSSTRPPQTRGRWKVTSWSWC
jgi:hypothetical protein